MRGVAKNEVWQIPEHFCSPMLSHTKPIPFCSMGIGLQIMLEWAWIHVQYRRYGRWYAEQKNSVTQLQRVLHVYEESTVSMADSSHRGFFWPGCARSRCSLCQDVLKPSHTHPKQWNPEVLELLKQYCPGIPPSACICKADEMSLRRKVNGMVKGEFLPRWVKRERTKTVPQCCVPGCSAVSERACSCIRFL